MDSSFAIIQALCRSALSSTKEMTEHQIGRLIDCYKKSGMEKEAKSLEGILAQSRKIQPMEPLGFVISSLEGDDLTRNTTIPVDKETATPILEIIFQDDLEKEMPLFNESIQSAVDSVINEWRNYDKLVQLSASPSRSCLIYGDPGTGKTMLAKWIAKSVGLPVVLAKLDGIVSSFLGTSSRNIANLFRFANKYKCILLLDEFDALAKLRDDPQEIGEVKRIVNTLLQNLDARSEKGFTIGITNHEKLLDPAVWRRFDVQIDIPHPNPEVREKMFADFISPLEYTQPELKFINWCMEDATGADLHKLSDWLKRIIILEESESRKDGHQHLDSHQETGAVEHEVCKSILVGIGQFEEIYQRQLDEIHSQIRTYEIGHKKRHHLSHAILEVETRLGVATSACKNENDKRHDAQQRIVVVPQHVRWL